MKKVLFGLFFFNLLLVSCSSNNKVNTFNNEKFYFKAINESTCAVGNVISISDDDKCLYIPSIVNNYKVVKLGFSSGIGFGGNGYFSAVSHGNKIRLYCPSTIENVHNSYLANASLISDIFYCGDVVNFETLTPPYMSNIYVLSENYDAFIEANKSTGININKANVVYKLNEDSIYYVDYYSNGSVIEYIPPVPTQDGYTFTGWYSDILYQNAWNFDNDKINMLGDDIELVLYAGWQKN